jgi:LysM repeat protein
VCSIQRKKQLSPGEITFSLLMPGRKNGEEVKMIKKIRLLALSAIIGLILASCNIGNPGTTDNPALISQLSVVTLELTAQADTSVPFTAVGQIIKINYSIKNTGSAGVTGVVTVAGATTTCPGINTIGNLDNSLDPNETLVCPSVYSITQADLDKGSATIAAMATVNGINSNPVTTTVPILKPKAVSLTTAANPSTYDQVGRQISFTYVIKNSGSASLGPTQFTVTDSLMGATPINCGAADTTLAPTATVTCSAIYSITQADMNAVSVTNLATASGGGAAPSQPASTTISKSSVGQSNPPNPAPGNPIQYTVAPGDWLWQIARCNGVDPNNLAADNKVQIPNPSQISPGMILTVKNPGSFSKYYGPPCVAVYTVQSSDTWNSIAQKYNADVVVLQRANSGVLSARVVVPCNSAPGPTAPCNSTGGNTLPSTQNKVLTLTTTANPVSYDQAGQQITASLDPHQSTAAVRVPVCLRARPCPALPSISLRRPT